MYNPDQQPQQKAQLMAPPRMSFSCDFALDPPPPRASTSGPPRASTAGDADFEFSAGGGAMMAADQLFAKGRILPLRDAPPTTLREELRAHAGGSDRRRRADRPASSGGSRWKELLGLRKKKSAAEAVPKDSHVVSNVLMP